MTRRLPPLAVLVLTALAVPGCESVDPAEPAVALSLDPQDALASAYLGSLRFNEIARGAVGSGTPYQYAVLQARAGDEVFVDATSRAGDDLFLFLYRLVDGRWQQIATNDDCYDGTLNSCLTTTSGRPQTYAALVTTYDYAYRGVPRAAGFDVVFRCFSCLDRGLSAP